MLFDRKPVIRTKPDGSIDTSHYVRIGRGMRGQQIRMFRKFLFPDEKPSSVRV